METRWCDPEMTLRFLHGLYLCDATPLTVQLVPTGVTLHHPSILTGVFSDLLGTLWQANRAGASIFVTINATDGAGRKTANVTGLRALFIDIDDPAPINVALNATMTVWSGHGWHVYWALKAGEPLAAFTPAQKQLARFYGSDPAVCDLPRAMRLPGFLNPKPPVAPVQVTMQTRKRWTIADVLAQHPVAPEPVYVPPPRAADTDTETRRYRAWAQRKDTTEGQRNRTAFSIAADGFRRGLAPAVIAEVVRAYCVRAGIAAEAETVLRSATRRAHQV